MADFYTYILTNPDRITLYAGMTNEMCKRLTQHYEEHGNPKTFAGRYYCHRLVYYEIHETAYEAIQREKTIEKWRGAKKEALIASLNPQWRFLSDYFWKV